MSRVELISSATIRDRVGDVVFVHGLEGHFRTTWHPAEKDNDNDFWLVWLGQALPHLTIWSVHYSAPLSEWSGAGLALTDRAKNVLDRFADDGIGTRPLIFITHSYGGLLVKEMVRKASGDAGTNFQLAQILSHIKGIVFLSTPHTGAHLANVVRSISWFSRPTVIITELTKHDPGLRSLNEWYRSNVAALHITSKVYYETQETRGILVIDPGTADLGLPGANPIPIEANHKTICKPKTTGEEVYRGVANFIQQCFGTGRYLIQRDVGAISILDLDRNAWISIPLKEPGLPNEEYAAATMNIGSWKIVHSATETFFSQFITFRQVIIRLEEAVDSRRKSLETHIARAQDAITALQRPIALFEQALVRLPRELRQSGMLSTFEHLRTVFNVLKRGLATISLQSYSPDAVPSEEVNSLVQISERLEALLLNALHIADEVLQKHIDAAHSAPLQR